MAGELVRLSGRYIIEAVADGLDLNGEETAILASILESIPDDGNREQWIGLLTQACLGRVVQQEGNSIEYPVEDLLGDVEAQLLEDEERWGDTWRHRTIEGQAERTAQRIVDYKDQHERGGQDINWLKIIGGAIICLVRLDHPEYIYPDAQ